MTKVTAAPMPTAVSIFLETPKNGQIPRNWEKIKLLVRIAPSAMASSFVTLILYFASFSSALAAFFFSALASAHCMAAISAPRHRKPPTGSVRRPMLV